MEAGLQFSGRVAVVTGGGASLGRSIVESLARRGCAVVIADRDIVSARGLAAEIAIDGAQVLALETDVTNASSLERMALDTIARFGQIDFLVNNAGVLGPVKPLWETTDADVERVYAINVRAVFACTRVVLRYMMQRRSGSIVTIASVAGKDGPKDLSIYASSKAAVIGFTKSWGKELAPHGIRANCVSPSVISATGMGNELPAQFGADSVSRIPMGRPALAGEVANVVAFLLSDEAGFVTGTCYDVSGGRATY